MSRQALNYGAAPDDHTGDPLRTSFLKSNANFAELYSFLGGDSLSLQAGRIPFGATQSPGDAMTSSGNLTYTEASGPQLTVGSGAGTSAGWTLGYFGISGVSLSGDAGLWATGLGAPTTGNFVLAQIGTTIKLNTTNSMVFGVNNNDQVVLTGTNSGSPFFDILGGTSTIDQNALRIAQTWNNAAVGFTALKANITNSASGATSLLMDLQIAGASQFSVDRVGGANINGSGHLSLLGATGGSGVRFGDGSGGYAYMQMLADGSYRHSNLALDKFFYLNTVADKVLGVGDGSSVNSLGTVQAKHNSSDGTAGITFSAAAILTLTVKDGLVVAKT